jgi:methionyl-tRNA synthetase
MADLSDVYGQNFQTESYELRLNYILNNLANNIAHRQFKFHLHDNNELWNKSQNLTPQAIKTLIAKVKGVNKRMHLIHINKNSNQINMLPELIIDTPVEYFLIIDEEFGRAYFIYITPTEVNSY